MPSYDGGIARAMTNFQGKTPKTPRATQSDSVATAEQRRATTAAATEALALSPWNTSTSPMLTSLHAHHHLRSPRTTLSKIRPNKRSFSFDDRQSFKQVLLPTLVSQEELCLLQSNDMTGRNGNGQEKAQQQFQDEKRVIHSLVEDTPVAISITYGIINATIVLPVIMSFGSIIYRDVAFQPYLNVLIKMTVISGVVHQLCFSALSSLPFAVGQVQDAGLIFLSSMAATLVQACRDKNADDETLLATATVGLSLSTALLGLSLVLIGKLKLAQWVQMLPTCVVGGYLAYIGFFCGTSGVGLMAGEPDVTWTVFTENIHFILPGILGGVFIYSLVRILRHMAVLPTCIVFLFCIFYLVLWLRGVSVEEATDQGWIAKTEPPPVWYHSWDYLKFDKVLWSALPQVLLTEISMIFVVALSSSLDIAAIELELQQPLDYDSELKMIGISNFISGMTGGYTGSYIFSQSIFNLRAGIRSPLAGYVLAACEILFLVAPFSILAYVPNFFFGSLLSLICVDLVFEWLIESRHKLTTAEYILTLSTFALILVTGVEYGIVLGVVLYTVCKKLGLDLGEEEPESEENNDTASDPSEPIDTRTMPLKSGVNGGSYGAVSNK